MVKNTRVKVLGQLDNKFFIYWLIYIDFYGAQTIIKSINNNDSKKFICVT